MTTLLVDRSHALLWLLSSLIACASLASCGGDAQPSESAKPGGIHIHTRNAPKGWTVEVAGRWRAVDVLSVMTARCHSAMAVLYCAVVVAEHEGDLIDPPLPEDLQLALMKEMRFDRRIGDHAHPAMIARMVMALVLWEAFFGSDATLSAADEEYRFEFPLRTSQSKVQLSDTVPIVTYLRTGGTISDPALYWKLFAGFLTRDELASIVVAAPPDDDSLALSRLSIEMSATPRSRFGVWRRAMGGAPDRSLPPNTVRPALERLRSAVR